MKTLRVRWKRLVHNNQTCLRCESTGEELEKAISILKEITAPLGIQVVLEKDELPIEAFRENPLESNRIWINGGRWKSGLVEKLDRAHVAMYVDPIIVEQSKWTEKSMKQSHRTS